MGIDAEISKLRIVTETSASSAITGIEKLATALSKLKKAVGNASFSGLTNAAEAIKSFAESASSLTEAQVSRVERLANAVSKLRGFRMTDKATSKLGKVLKDAEGGTGTVDGAGKAPGVLPPAEKPKDDIKKTPGKLQKLFSSLLRIGFYRLIRRALQMVTQAFAEGYQNAVLWARYNNRQLYDSIRKVTSAGLAMKNALGAALAQLEQLFEPILVKLALAVAHVGNAFSNLFAVLHNDPTYQKAKTDVEALYAAQQKLNASLMKFDEINKLNSQNGYGTNINDMFEPEETSKSKAAWTGILSILSIGGLVALGKLFKGGGGILAGASIGKKLLVLFSNGMQTLVSSIVTAAKSAFISIGTAINSVIATLGAAGIAIAGAIAVLGVVNAIFTNKYLKENPVENYSGTFTEGYTNRYGWQTSWFSRKAKSAGQAAYDDVSNAEPTYNPAWSALQGYTLARAANSLGLSSGESRVTIDIQMHDQYGNLVTREELELADVINNRAGRVVIGSPGAFR